MQAFNQLLEAFLGTQHSLHQLMSGATRSAMMHQPRGDVLLIRSVLICHLLLGPLLGLSIFCCLHCS